MTTSFSAFRSHLDRVTEATPCRQSIQLILALSSQQSLRVFVLVESHNAPKDPMNSQSHTMPHTEPHNTFTFLAPILHTNTHLQLPVCSASTQVCSLFRGPNFPSMLPSSFTHLRMSSNGRFHNSGHRPNWKTHLLRWWHTVARKFSRCISLKSYL